MQVESEESSMWSRLPSELLSSILNRLPLLDHLRCHRCVCRSWRSADVPHRPTNRYPPLLFLPDHQDPSLGNLFTLADQKPQRIRLPPATAGLRFHGSSNGWLVYADSSANLHLINPLTSAHLPLPPITAFSTIKQAEVDPDGHISCTLHDGPQRVLLPLARFYTKLVVLSPPSSSSSMVTFVVYGFHKSAFARPDDKTWTDVVCLGSDYDFHDIVHHKGQLYAVSDNGRVVTIDISVSPATVSSYPSSLLVNQVINHKSVSLVESSMDRTELLQVRKYITRSQSLKRVAITFRVLRLDSSKNKWVGVERLEGSTAIFLGGNETMSVSVKDFPEMKENCIYFTDGNNWDPDWTPYRTGVYNLKDGKIEPLLGGSSTWSLPSWFAPSL